MDALRPLSLDQFAALTAEMEAGLPRDRVLADGAVSAEQWELTQETWLLRMAKQGAQRKLALLDRYNELLAKHRKAAQRKMRVEKRKLKGAMPVPPEAHLSPLARARDEAGATFQKPGLTDQADRGGFVAPVAPAGFAEPVAPAGFAAPVAPAGFAPAAPAGFAEPVEPPPQPAAVAASGPAWLQAQRPPAALVSTAQSGPMPLPAAAVAGPAWLSAKPPPRGEEPKPQAALAAASSAVAAAPPAAGPSWLRSSASLPSSPVLPAQPAAQAAQPQIAAAPQRATPFPIDSGTRPANFTPGLSMADRAAWIAALDQPSTVDAPPPAQPAQPAAAKRHPLSETRGPDFTSSSAALPSWVAGLTHGQPAPAPKEPPPNRGGALPFQAAAPQPATTSRTSSSPSMPAMAPAIANPAQPIARPAAPAPPQAPPARPRLSLEQLAWLQAQADASAELGRTAREQLGLSETEVTAERAIWQVQLQQDRAMVERYSQLFYHYRRALGR